MEETLNLTFESLPKAVSQLADKLDKIEKLLNKKEYQPTPPPPEKLLTIQEAAKFLSLTVPTIYSKTSKGELPVMKRSKRLYFSRNELLAYLQAGRKKTNIEIEAEAASHVTTKWRK